MNDCGDSQEPAPPRKKRISRLQLSLRTLFVVIAALAVLSTLWVNRHRDAAIQRALLESREPPVWWPSGWRQELTASFTIEGDISVAGKAVGAGTILFILEPEQRVFPATIRKGRYSFKHTRMPTGRYKVEVRTDDGSEPQTSRSKWELPMDQGFHRINLALQRRPTKTTHGPGGPKQKNLVTLSAHADRSSD
jgi:hypothetical protein